MRTAADEVKSYTACFAGDIWRRFVENDPIDKGIDIKNPTVEILK
jgi:hypothetical protein